MEEKEKKEKGLKMHTIVFMGSVALFFDALGAIFTAAAAWWVITIFWALTFFVWFLMHGILFWKPKRLLTAGGSLLIEFIPILNLLPAMTAAVLIVAFDAKLKEVSPVPLSKKSAKNNIVPFKRRSVPSTPGGKKAA